MERQRLRNDVHFHIMLRKHKYDVMNSNSDFQSLINNSYHDNKADLKMCFYFRDVNSAWLGISKCCQFLEAKLSRIPFHSHF